MGTRTTSPIVGFGGGDADARRAGAEWAAMTTGSEPADRRLLGIQAEARADSAVVYLTGTVGAADAPQLAAELERLLEGGVRHVLIDLGAVDHFDEAALGVVTAAKLRLGEDGSINLCHPSPDVLQTLRTLGFVDEFVDTEHG
jgi:anti-sigma B factor antagonist